MSKCALQLILRLNLNLTNKKEYPKSRVPECANPPLKVFEKAVSAIKPGEIGMQFPNIDLKTIRIAILQKQSDDCSRLSQHLSQMENVVIAVTAYTLLTGQELLHKKAVDVVFTDVILDGEDTIHLFQKKRVCCPSTVGWCL